MSFDERLAKRGADTFLRELGFDVHSTEFNKRLLNGQLDAFDAQQLQEYTSIGLLRTYYAHQAKSKQYREEATKALLVQDSIALMEGWRTFQHGFYYGNEKRWGYGICTLSRKCRAKWRYRAGNKLLRLIFITPGWNIC